MMGMMNISFTKEELLKMNKKLNKIKKTEKIINGAESISFFKLLTQRRSFASPSERGASAKRRRGRLRP